MAVRFFLALCVCLLTSAFVLPSERMPAVPPTAVEQQGVPETVIHAKPHRVVVGAHINDILEVDLRSHSYRLDLYVWFRWHDPSLKPWETAEFMNAFDPADHVRTPVYDAPLEMPDGSLYMVMRQQGKFSAKFPLQIFPFDHQSLVVLMEDSVDDVEGLVYVPDSTVADGISINSDIYLPGFDLGDPALVVRNYPYETHFGDIGADKNTPYARASFSVPVTRPALATGIKIFLPVGLVLFCMGLVFFVHPAYIEGRLGVAITALLTLVALQLTTANGLPDVDYLLMTDKIYFLSYLFIIGGLMQLVRTSAQVRAEHFQAVSRSDRRMLILLSALFMAGTAGIVASVVYMG